MLILLLCSSCSSSPYYFYQASKGQLSLFNRARPLEQVIQDPRTDPSIAGLLKSVPEIKTYGEKFGLKPTPNYRDYVSLDRDSVVYVVTVCKPLQFEPKIFSFPLVGSFNYLGWFSESDAKDFAKKFEDEGMDVDVRGASAYSTLGWFDDPLLSSMIPMDEGRATPSARGALVNVVLHESVHATVYINNQSYFNEGLAAFVADILTQKYFKDHQLLETQEWKAYQDSEKRGEEVRARLLKAVADLKIIYDSSASDDVKKEKKLAYLESLQKEYPRFRKITNATLVQYQTYHSTEGDFLALYKRKQEDLGAFMAAIAKLRLENFKQPHQESFGDLLSSLN